MAHHAPCSGLIRAAIVTGCLVCSSIAVSAPLRLQYWAGIRDGATKSDGVTFRVEIIEPGKPAVALADKHCAGRGWQAFDLDLSIYRDREVIVRFSTAPGDAISDDWACWGEPRIVDGENVLLDFTKAKIWRSGIVVNGQERSPMDQTNTGATFLTGSNTCGGERKKGFFAHPPWRGDGVGGIAFAEFRIVVGAALAAEAKRSPLPVELPAISPFPWGIAPCFKLHSPIMVDGALDDWPEEIAAAFLSIRDKEQMCVEVVSHKPGFKAGWRGPGDLSAGVYVAWDDSNLYLAQIRRDDVLRFMDTMSQDFSRSDSVRVCVSRDPAAKLLTENDVVLAINPEGEMGKPMVRVCGYKGYRHSDFPVGQIAVAPAFYGDGYVMEMRIPFAVLGIVPKPGLTLGFQVVIDDSDTPMDRHYEMLWRPKAAADYYQNPSSFGRLTLCDSAFAWLALPRRVYAVGEAPRPDFGLHVLDRELKARLRGTLLDAQGGIVARLTKDALSHGNPVTLPPLTVEGGYRFEYVLEAGGDTTKGAMELVAIRDRKPGNLLRLGPPATPTLLPSVGAQGYTNRVVKQGDLFLFEYVGEDCRVSYTCRPAPGFDIAIACDGKPIYQTAARETGPTVTIEGKAIPLGRSGATVSDVALKDNVLSYTCRVADAGSVIYRFRVEGKTLIVEASSEQALFPEFRGPLHGMKAHEPFIPYLGARMNARLIEGCYVSSYADWTVTGSSSLRRLGSTRYDPKTDGTRNPLTERVYVTVSPELLEVLPNLPNPPSPFMELLSAKLVLDIWRFPGGFEGCARYLEALKGYGVDEMAIIYHVWQKHGYDNGLPEHVPAVESMGGDAGMKVLGATAKRFGYLFSLHENYIDYYPNYPEYTEDGVGLNSRGEKIEGWYMPSTGIQAYLLKPSWMERYARDQSTKAHDWYQTSAAYLDVHSVNLPWRVDFDAEAEGAASFRYSFEKTTWLFNFMRETHGGPLLGEGNMHAAWAGRIDGCEAQIGGRAGEIKPVLVDFDLLKVHPLTVNHGMGYYSRWHRTRSGRMTDEARDKYRAQELAYGHAGFFLGFTDLTHVLRDYYLVQPIQARYVLARPEEIRYLFDEEWVSSLVACRTDAQRKVHVAYDNGLRLWVNDDQVGWTVEGKRLPAYGFVAKGAGVEAWTALVGDGLVADYVETKDRIFADPRGYETHYVDTLSQVNVKPLQATVKFLSARTFEITYQWEVNQKPAKDYIAFVHFTDEQGAICWQGDHRPDPRTNAWSVGSTVVDGPFTVKIPDHIRPAVYDIRLGLFRPGEGKLALTGREDGRTRYTVGRIEVKAEGTEVGFLPPRKALGSLSLRPGRNPEGTRIDFGALVTDITVRIDRSESALLVMPIPHGREGTVTLRLGRLAPGKSVKGSGVVALGSDSAVLAKVPCRRNATDLSFTTTVEDAWFYRVDLE